MHTAAENTPNVTPTAMAGARRVDVVRAQPRPLTSVALVVAQGGPGVYRYAAASAEQRWTGEVRAESTETAILDVMGRLRGVGDRVQFLVKVPARSTLWALRDEISMIMPGVYLERPRLSDEALVRAACGCLPTSPSATGPVVVATDGSVRGKYTGYGWLASTGEYGLQGFRHDSKQIGPMVVLVAELRAIGKAVENLRGRDITVLSDSKLAVAMVKRWMAGEDVLPEGYTVYRENGKTPGLVASRRVIVEERARITPVWVKGHQGEPLNEGADALARLASRYQLRDSGLGADEYHRRAKDLAVTFAAAYHQQQSA